MRDYIEGIIDKLLGESNSLRLRPVSGLALLDKKKYTWSVTNDDPQFVLKSWKGSGLLRGYYRLKIVGGKYINRLGNASLYYDSGRGFNQHDRIALAFREEAGDSVAYIFLSESARRIRFDPVEGRRVTFAGRAIRFERITERDHEKSLVPLQVQREFRPGVAGNMNLLVNLFRLLPGHKGAGGAGRLALACLKYLPEFANVRVIIAEHNEGLIPEFPDIDFVISASESYSDLKEHLDWCDCYFDFLNGLRPTYIPSDVVVLGCLLDLQHMRFPMLFSQAELAMRLKEYGYAIDRADQLVAISDYERENLDFFYGKSNVSVVPLSGFAAEDYLEDRRAPVALSKANFQTYLMYPAVPWAHKNHETLVQAMAVLKHSGRHVRIVLTNTDSNPDNKRRLLRLCEAFDLQDAIEFKGFVSEPEIIALMRKSSGIVFPTLYEGFGIPLVDAMKLGIPVLASDISAIREVCDDAVSYFANNRNAVLMAEDIWRFWCSQDERVRSVAAGLERSKLYSSRRMAKEVVDAARKALVSREGRSYQLSAPDVKKPEKSILSLLVFVQGADIANNAVLASSIKKLTNALGDQVEVTIALDVALVSEMASQAAFDWCSKLLVFKGISTGSRIAAVDEFTRRYNNSEFHIVVDWSESRMFSSSQIFAMVQGLRHNPDAKYAVVDPKTKDVTVGNPPSEPQIIERFEALRTQGNVIYGTMFRCDGGFRDLRHGTTQFLSAYCTEASWVRVPLIEGVINGR